MESELQNQIRGLEDRVDQLLQDKMLDQREHQEFQDSILAIQQESMAGLKRAIDQKNQMQELYEREKRRRQEIEHLYQEAEKEYYQPLTKPE